MMRAMPTSRTSTDSAPARRKRSAPASRPAPVRKARAAADPRTQADPAARVLRQFRTVFNSVRNHFRTMEQAVGLSGTEVWALSHVAAHPGMGVGQLARAMDIHQSTASNLVRALLEARMVVSERSEGDQRAVHLHTTAKGLKLLAKAPTPFVGVLPEALRRLDAPTLRRLERDLARLIRELDTDPDGDAARTIIAADQD
jgi:DNA-binding MarR family transcriptional regulator